MARQISAVATVPSLSPPSGAHGHSWGACAQQTLGQWRNSKRPRFPADLLSRRCIIRATTTCALQHVGSCWGSALWQLGPHRFAGTASLSICDHYCVRQDSEISGSLCNLNNVLTLLLPPARHAEGSRDAWQVVEAKNLHTHASGVAACPAPQRFGHMLHGSALSRQVMQHTLSAVAYCHSKGVIHKDLKPENVMMSSPRTAPVQDAGVLESEREGGC